MSLWHRHCWRVIDKDVQPSSAEMLKQLGAGLKMKDAWPDQLNAVTRRPVLVTYRCDCGAEKVARV